ncbi:MAG: lytic transglycosylase domain-containing protein [Oligoflexia bacterium]|nr:lytic transglycosylase domain-containing protein [Oligoflexia bacterium]MBF0366314.1 lytic transglycosylase domain-containing protein [Oligoflexia bacterium]
MDHPSFKLKNYLQGLLMIDGIYIRKLNMMRISYCIYVVLFLILLIQHKDGAVASILKSDTTLTNKLQIYSLPKATAKSLALSNYHFDIPVVYNAAVKKWISYFTNEGRSAFISYGKRSGRYAPILRNILKEQNLPGDLIFLAMAESGFFNRAKSSAHAVGPWQFINGTGIQYGLTINWFVDERQDPIKSTIAAGRYLKKLHQEFRSWELAFAAYNAGEGKVWDSIRRFKKHNFWQLAATPGALHSETREHIPKIMALAIVGKNLEAYGFSHIDFESPLDFDEVLVPASTDLKKLAFKMALSYDEIKKYNPELKRWFTPTTGSNYPLRLPLGYGRVWNKCCKNSTNFAALNSFQRMLVESHEITLRYLGNKLNIDAHILSQINNMPLEKKIKRGDIILLPIRSEI